MTAVVDTNVWVSALLWGGTPLAALEHARKKQWTLVTSEAIIAEIQDVVSRPRFGSWLQRGGWTVDTFVRTIESVSVVAPDSRSEHRRVVDPKDEKFLVLALAVGADAIVSGDHHLLDVGEIEGIPILTPQQFLRRLKR